MNEISVMLIGLAIRFGIPVLLTILAIVLLRRFDQQWRENAQARRAQLIAAGVAPRNTGCWNIMGCTEEKRATCKAFAQQDLPCFQSFRSTNGELQERCLACKVFKNMPVPVMV